MTALPNHGRIDCSRCFDGKLVEFDKTRCTRGDWRITANPLAWGNPIPQIVVLGFSKGPTQAGALASAPHDEIAYKGGRANAGKILQHIGLLRPSRGETVADAVSRAIAERNGSFHFGSLIRCTVERYESKDEKWKGSGGGMLDKFVATDFGRTVAANCVERHLANLPGSTKLVVMFGMGQMLNYVDSAFELFKSVRGGEWQRLNDVSYTDGRIVVVHVEHFASQGKLVPEWLDAQCERGRLGAMAREAVAFALKGVKLATQAPAKSGGGKSGAARSQLRRPIPAARATAAPSVPEHLPDAFSRRFSFLLKSGEELFPIRMTNRDTGLLAFRVSAGGTGGNTKAAGIEVKDEDEMVRYVLERGYSVRASSLDKGKYGLYRPHGRSVLEVRVAKPR